MGMSAKAGYHVSEPDGTMPAIRGGGAASFRKLEKGGRAARSAPGRPRAKS